MPNRRTGAEDLNAETNQAFICLLFRLEDVTRMF